MAYPAIGDLRHDYLSGVKLKSSGRKVWDAVRPQSWRDAVALVTTLIILAIGVHYYYQVNLEGDPPVTINSVTLAGDATSFAPGDDILIRLDYCRHTTAAADYSGRFVDTQLISLPNLHVEAGPADCRVVTVPVKVPPIPAGQYYLEFSGAYYVNPRATRVVTWRTEWFTVTP